jgi:galactokinase
MENLFSLHQKEHISDPEVIVEAPGSITVMGNHVDSNDGYMLQAAVDSCMQVAISRRKDNSLRFFAPDLSERKRTTVINIKYKREDRWANFIKGVLSSLDHYGYNFKGLDITVTGNVPPGIGLSSSPAIGVATAIAVSKLIDKEIKPEDIVKMVYNGENNFIGLSKIPSGAYSSLYGEKDSFLFVDLKKREVQQIPSPFDDVNIMITISNVPGIPIDNEIQERIADTKKCISGLNSIKSGSTLRDYSMSDLRHGMGVVPEYVRRRCIHVVDEIRRTLEAKTAMEKKDFFTLGKLMNRSHESLRDNFEVSCPEIDWLVKRAQEIDGIYGSKITGSGFGGCTVTLIKNSAIDKYQERLDEYERIFGFKAEMIKCSPSTGAKVIYSVD